MSGCIGPTGDRTEAVLVVESRYDAERTFVVRFEEGDIVSFQERVTLDPDESVRVEDDLFRGADRADVFVEVLVGTEQETVHETAVEAGRDEYRLLVGPDGIDVVNGDP
ncbi:hypothetical protein [Halorubrum sp. DTA98]|uniref:hypothetical protein n=1 Tax=Halorubrum sp. DTA98 TaxID=3402163 RepID=UPI003AADEE0D